MATILEAQIYCSCCTLGRWERDGKSLLSCLAPTFKGERAIVEAAGGERAGVIDFEEALIVPPDSDK